MSYKQWIKSVVVATVGVVSPMWGSCPLSFIDGTIAPSPMTYHGDANMTLTPYIVGSGVPASDGFGPSCTFKVELSKIDIKDNDLSNLITTAAEPAGSDILDYFTLTTSVLDNGHTELRFVQKADLPDDWYAAMLINLDVTGESTSSEVQNSFQANVVGNANEASKQTYTASPTLVAVSDSNNSVDGDTGGVVIANIFANDTINGEAVIIDEDVRLQTITTNTILEINTTSGEVSVPAGTEGGTYIETYSLCDNTYTDVCSEATVTVKVANNLPDALNDTNTTLEDTEIDLPVLGNDTDPDGDALIIQSFTQTNNGTVTDNGDGTLKYVPSPNYHGTDNFTYTITDGNGGTDTATVTITVTPVNDVPVAVDDTNTTPEDTEIDLPVLQNDPTDADGDVLSIESFTQPSNGTVTDNGDGTLKYVPSPNYHGTDNFTYTITDGNGGTDTATVTITVTLVNDIPVAIDDSNTTPEDTEIDLSVLGNDTDIDGDLLSIQSFTQANSGTVTDNGDGTLKYVPSPNYHGTDNFTYTITDGNGGTDTATVTITVTPVNDVPIAVDDTNTTPEDTEIDLSVLSNDTDIDGDLLSIQSFTQANNGIVTDNGDGTLKYVPSPNYHGTDNFTYIITDGNGGTDTATVTITVSNINDKPIANNDASTTPEDHALNIAVSINDTDADGDDLTVASFTQPSNGTVTKNADGTLKYVPNPNYHGTDTFTYVITDGNGGTDTATVTVEVTPLDDAPVAVDDSNTTPEDTEIDLSVLSNDTDVDGDVLSILSFTQPSNGTVTDNGDGTLKYVPNSDFHGTDMFTYTITDGELTDTAIVNITISAVNDVPIAVDDNSSTIMNEDKVLTLTDIVTSNDRDPDSDPLTISAVGNATHGTIVLNADGTVTFTPEHNYIGIGTFEYTISDGQGGTDTATVTMDIMTILPEYELILDVTPTIITVENSPMDILLQVTEYDRGVNSGDLIIFLSKDVTTEINFDSELSTLGGRTLSNSEWEYKKTPVGYQFKYIANGGKFPSYNRLYIGLKAVFSTPVNVIGKIPVNVQILDGSGDKNILNNIDAISVSHSYIIN